MSMIGTPERVEDIGTLTASANATTRLEIPTYDDIKALDVRVKTTLTTIGDAGDNAPYAPLGNIKDFRVEGDGHKNLFQGRGYHLIPTHKQFYNSPCTLTAPASDAQVMNFKARVPIGVFRHQFRDVVVKVLWGDGDDDINTNAGFALASQVMYISAVYGRVRESYRTHYVEDTGSALSWRVPARGILVGESLISVDGTESTYSALEIEHEGRDLIDSDWNALGTAESIQTQQAHDTGILNIVHNVATVKDNTYVYLTSSSSKTVELLMFFVTQIKKTVKRGKTVTMSAPIPTTTPQGRVKAFGQAGAIQLAKATVPRGPVYSLVGSPASIKTGFALA